MHRSRKNKKSGCSRDKRQKKQDKTNHEGDNSIAVDQSECSQDGIIKNCGTKNCEIKLSDIMGRYLVATKNFHPSELILDEEAIVVGPCQGAEPVCLICYRPLFPQEKFSTKDPEPVPCKKCNWPLCGTESCIRTRTDPHTFHDHSRECKVFSAVKEANKSFPDPLKEHSLFEAIVPLRCLLYRDSAPQLWEAVSVMESHNAIRKNLPNIWSNNQEKVVYPIRELWGLADKFSEDMIHTVCGVLEVNAFEVGHNGSSLRALFGPYAYLIAHSCISNTSHIDAFEPHSTGKKCTKSENYESGIFRLKVRATIPISRGDTIYLSYAHTLLGTMVRRDHLQQSKFFSCTCERCKDPTELGTFLSALRCPLCEGVGSHGKVLPKDPLDDNTEWRCDSCSRYTMDSSSVTAILERISAESESIKTNDVAACEAFLQRYRNVLHPSHYLAVGIKHSLSQLYGKTEGYTIPEMPRSLLERKRDICKELLDIFDIIEPGYSRLRGITLYELHAPMMTIITRNLEEGKVNANRDKKELTKQIRAVFQCLEEARDILKSENPMSPEASMAAAASEGLKGLNKWLSRMT